MKDLNKLSFWDRRGQARGPQRGSRAGVEDILPNHEVTDVISVAIFSVFHGLLQGARLVPQSLDLVFRFYPTVALGAAERFGVAHGVTQVNNLSYILPLLPIEYTPVRNGFVRRSSPIVVTGP